MESSSPHHMKLNLTVCFVNEMLAKSNSSYTCDDIIPMDHGWNNLAYKLLQNNSAKNNTKAMAFMLRLSNKASWSSQKMQAERGAQRYFREKLGGIIPIPQLLAHGEDELDGYSFWWGLHSHLHGIPLNQEVWNHLSEPIQQQLKCQMNAIVLKCRQHERFDSIGGIVYDETAQSYSISTYAEGWGPFHSIEEWINGLCDHYVKQCETTPKFERWRRFIPTLQKIRKTYRELLSSNNTTEIICLVHGDFNLRNFLYDPEEETLSGLVDFEYAGSLPCTMENILMDEDMVLNLSSNDIIRQYMEYCEALAPWEVGIYNEESDEKLFQSSLRLFESATIYKEEIK